MTSDTASGHRLSSATQGHTYKVHCSIIVQRAGVGDAAVPAGWHLVGVHDGAALGVAALVGLQRVREIVCCLLGTGLATRSV